MSSMQENLNEAKGGRSMGLVVGDSSRHCSPVIQKETKAKKMLISNIDAL